MSRDGWSRRTGRGPSRLLTCLLLLIGVLAMHGLTMDHDAAPGMPAVSGSTTPDATPTVALPAVTAHPTDMPGMEGMLGGMCVAVLLTAGIRLLVRRAGRAAPGLDRPARPRWHHRPRRVIRHDPPGALLLRLCVMRT